ncbi:MAG: SDR family oxidoreductase, partial [Saprospiraceae bacterium]|nr:SDR family oxidoreductase [Saprospiraceae bacterium]
MTGLKNKTALITGGTKGIGYAVAEAFLREGMNVVITGRNKAGTESAINNLRSIGENVQGVIADVRNLDDQKHCVEQTIQTFGKLDVLIANAGVGHFAPIDELSVKDWNEVIDTNLTGVFYSVKASLDQLKKNQGYIITIASLAGTNFFASGTAYNASKFGLVGFSQALMLDLRRQGIKVSTVMPGSV